ncbi:tetratricopeptide repeat protein [Simiduia aestuariiviva]|uniref:Tetratricopeptide (TPR) repeat protein n=1 Tax=Simiduia aestuariiviva TaxID=1510459 RepID=A0A839UXJ0_9GAMM|nr:tetratricopeptide repeat protein [Simiduia aestuariiviva]MBB3170077.1 tetratricopeptide (TPR) repeat protein [Simiduia aestuariiviva]
MKTHIKKYGLLLVLSVLAVGCSNDAQENAEKSARHLKSATVYEAQGQYRAAMLEARNVIQLNPDQDDGYLVLARIYNSIGAFGMTQKLLEPKVEAGATLSPELAVELAESYLASKKFRSASKLLETAQSADLNPALALERQRLLGEAYLYLKDQKAFDSVKASLSKRGGQEAQVVSLFLSAAESLANNKPDQAEASLKTLLSIDASYFDALTLSGDISMYYNRLDDAERAYTKAISGLPTTDVMLADKVFVLKRLIDTLTQLGRSAEAFTYQKILADANPGSYEAQQKFEEALSSYIRGDLDTASAILKELREDYPQDKNSATLLGMVAQQQGQNEYASQLFDEFVDTETAAPSVIQAAALAKINAKRSGEAMALLKAAVEQQPNNAGVLSTYGLALAELNNDTNEAMIMLERSLALNPDQPRLRIALAKSHIQKDNLPQAIAQLQKAHKDAPDDFLIQQVYYRTLAAADKKEELQQLIESDLAKNPSSAKAMFFKGWLELGANRYAQAKNHFERAIAKDDPTTKGLAFAGLAQAHAATGKLVEATQAWEETIKINPAVLRAYGQWLITLHRRGQIAQAEQRLADLNIDAKYWQPDYTMARLAFEQRKFEAALALAEKALSKNATNAQVKILAAEASQQVGFAKYQLGDVQGAKVAMLRAVQWSPENVTYTANLIKIELDAGNSDAAQKILDQYTGSENATVAKHYLQGKIFEQKGNPQQALGSYQAAWSIQPSDLSGEAIFKLLAATANKGADFLEQWKSALPESSKPVLFQAMTMQGEGKLDQAESLYQKALALAPDIPAALNNLAWIYHERGDERALPMAKKAFELAPSSAAIMDTYAWMLVEQGNVKEGHAILEQALALAPNNKEIQEHLAAAKAKL